MHRVLVLGAGKIGALISGLLGESGDYRIDLADLDGAAAESVVKAHGLANVRAFALDATAPEDLAAHLDAHPVDAVISGLPYFCNVPVAAAARQRGMHYFDLTEDVAVTEEVRTLAAGASTAFAPQCGLAPGFVSIAANELAAHFDEIHTVKLRVGALPQHPNNVLKYSLTWSTDGLINEYGNMCQSVEDGSIINVLPLEGLEEIEIDGNVYEAFNTSGGLGSLADSWHGRVTEMNYKTMRYPGHCNQMRLLMNGLKLNHDRDTLKRILENAVPRTLQDVVIVYVSVVGLQDGELREENYVNKVYPQIIAGRLWSAIQVTTAAGVCAVADLVICDPESHRGFVTQESFHLKDVLDNRFGRFYAHGGTNEVSARMIATGAVGHQRAKGA
ncbi:saccharopine dehydrogenase C-terminal domain-containing protein [Wenzhouxiangella sp. XN24]|uniref:saccharopine dehydrogenase family protein n=1 Tax=Wenzhouxiangella sp. XN24 TaxID=2713569 RepID=UPI0013EAE3F2|nr:saccharopine dehydrogenase C-terminal domain-containing protein [Wenzhouxiangella sp. XN24]NGX16600.1 saccharopine dehydrogenase family protein [Wenzhouxiangella sp. XN24]